MAPRDLLPPWIDALITVFGILGIGVLLWILVSLPGLFTP